MGFRGEALPTEPAGMLGWDERRGFAWMGFGAPGSADPSHGSSRALRRFPSHVIPWCHGFLACVPGGAHQALPSWALLSQGSSQKLPCSSESPGPCGGAGLALPSPFLPKQARTHFHPCPLCWSSQIPGISLPGCRSRRIRGVPTGGCQIPWEAHPFPVSFQPRT